MSQPHQITVVTGSIDYDHVVCTCQRIDGLGQRLASGGFILGSGIVETTETKMIGNFEVARNALGPATSVLDIMGEALLPGIEIDCGDALACLDQRNRNMHGDG